MIKVSVIIPVYNAEKYLRQCLDSVQGQSLRDIEIICVDDGSTDSSPDMLRERAACDSRMRIVTQANGGPGKARNTGMNYANGQYVIFLDADDWFEPDFLEKMAERADETCADICICKAQRFDDATGKELPSDWMLKTHLVPSGVFSPEAVAEHLFQFTYGQVWDKLYRRAFLDDCGIGFPELTASEDMPFAYMTLLCSERIAIVSEVLMHYRVNRVGSVSNSFVKQPEAPYAAFSLVYEYLLQNGLMEKYKKSFLNWAMEFLVWNLSNIRDTSLRRKYFYELRNIWFPKLNMESHALSYYESKKSYLKFICARYLPYPFFILLLNTYKNTKKEELL